MPAPEGGTSLSRRLWMAMALPIVLLLVLGTILGRQILQMTEDSRFVEESDRMLAVAHRTTKQMIDQETGLRGWLITEDRAFLEPFERAHPREGLDDLDRLTANDPPQRLRYAEARQRYERWLALAESSLDQAKIAEARSAEALKSRKAQMDAVRAEMDEAVAAAVATRDARQAAAATSITTTRWVFIGLLGGAAALLAFLSRRQLASIASTFQAALDGETAARRATEDEAWIRDAQATLAQGMQGGRTTPELSKVALDRLARHVGAEVGAFFTRDGDGWERRAGFGVDLKKRKGARFAPGDGLVGRAAESNAILRVRDGAEHLEVRGGTVSGAPREVVVIPCRSDDETLAVIELGFLTPPTARASALLERVGESVATAVRASEYRERLRGLLEEARRQSEELQSQQEELRSANDELQSQAHHLRSAQTELVQQQAELEGTNDHLARQAAELERKNHELADKQLEITRKAQEVARASQYKSEFLSNMSHELRTPLNSSLILSKLLSDNKDGNLTAEQVKFASTIYSAGNDLLALINDILDLSKVEAGKLEVVVQPAPLARIVEGLRGTFEPVAEQRGIEFRIDVDPTAPAEIETDTQRLEQIARNLISNALKFTERGEVVVRVSGKGRNGERVVFAVRDTGIGIAEEHREVVFEAFRQADGNTTRKYGGTGLGLSISRQLARLLGGDIELQSSSKGSTFTLEIPRVLAPDAQPPAGPVERPKPARPTTNGHANGHTNGKPHVDAVAPAPRLAPDKPLVLVIEDDEAFAEILVDVAREAGFEAITTTTAQRGLELARAHLPRGILLDMNLPDQSGLTVLDRLKRDGRTRHIPVHIVSVSDYMEAALSMGAVAYSLKPVARAQLVEAMQRLDESAAKRRRRVLVVDDDETLRESVASLLGSSDVEIRTAGSAGGALELLGDHAFDCVVTDLGMSDDTGSELLERVAREKPWSTPPIIVYTGRALTAAEEQRLRKYSKSIIVKGARSPERLLDEVTLFLHQAESELPAEQQRMLREGRNRDAAFDGRKILVVEDDVRNVFALTSVLEPRGARVSIARNGKEALHVLQEQPDTDLVLMDVMMPEMDGLSATRKIRENPKFSRLPIIALTAKARRDDQEKCLASGANDYLAKPLDVDVLVSLLRVWMPSA